MQNNLGIPPRFHLFFFNFKSSALKKSKMKTKKKPSWSVVCGSAPDPRQHWAAKMAPPSWVNLCILMLVHVAGRSGSPLLMMAMILYSELRVLIRGCHIGSLCWCGTPVPIWHNYSTKRWYGCRCGTTASSHWDASYESTVWFPSSLASTCWQGWALGSKKHNKQKNPELSRWAGSSIWIMGIFLIFIFPLLSRQYFVLWFMIWVITRPGPVWKNGPAFSLGSDSDFQVQVNGPSGLTCQAH